MSGTEPNYSRHHIQDARPWLADIAHVENLEQIVRRREPGPRDLTEILRDSFRLAQVTSRFPERTQQMLNAVARGSRAGSGAVLLQRLHKENNAGILHFTFQDASRREIPVGETSVTLPDWLRVFTLAVAARDEQSLGILCLPPSVAACDESRAVIDPFWLFYCSAFASLFAELDAVAGMLDEAELLLTQATIAESSFLNLRVKPVLAAIRPLSEKNKDAFHSALVRVVQAHQAYFSQPEHNADWKGFICFEAVALAILAKGLGMPVEIQSDYLPPDLIAGFSVKLPDLQFAYPPSAILSDHEARWFLDLAGFPTESRSHNIIDDGKDLHARYEAYGAPGMPPATADFLLPGSNASHVSAPLALDAGQLLHLAEKLSSGDEPQSKGPALLTEAVAAIDAALARIPPAADSVPHESIISLMGRKLYNEEPGRFRRNRLVAYRDALKKQLTALKADTSATARANALGFIEVIRPQVSPILQQFANDDSGQIIESLKPRADDFSKVFLPDALQAAHAYYDPIWESRLEVRLPTDNQTQLHIAVAPAGMLLTDNELFRKFPGGYRSAAPHLNPKRIWVAWKYTEPGHTSGMSYDGLVWCDDHWAWFPKPYRAFSSQK